MVMVLWEGAAPGPERSAAELTPAQRTVVKEAHLRGVISPVDIGRIVHGNRGLGQRRSCPETEPGVACCATCRDSGRRAGNRLVEIGWLTRAGRAFRPAHLHVVERSKGPLDVLQASVARKRRSKR